ncbi:MAG TPA: hypothetical protein PLS68_08325 [Actinotalea sp.]|nr:hypothetical protein [Actinotalea sp.]
MTEPENFTAQQAADPSTPGQVLADIAALRPELRAAVASNPSAYPGLLEWLGSLGEPTVDAALAARAGAEQPTVVLPTLPPVAAPQWQGQATTPAAPAPAYGAPAPGFEPQAPAYGAPAGYAPQPGQPYGLAPAGAPPKKGGNKVLVIVLSILGVLILLGVGAFFAIKALIGNVTDQLEDIDVPGITEGDAYGDNAELDALWDACETEDWAACDDLYFAAPIGSEYEAFGETCGNRTEASGGSCVTDMGGGATEDTGEDTGSDEPFGYGDDATLDALWDSCAGGDMAACDELYFSAPIDSEYESFGDTCGNTAEGGAACASSTTTGEPYNYGDDATLDALWDSCAAGDMAACDSLYETSPVGSIYETFGDTCAGLQEAGTTLWCDPNR